MPLKGCGSWKLPFSYSLSSNGASHRRVVTVSKSEWTVSQEFLSGGGLRRAAFTELRVSGPRSSGPSCWLALRSLSTMPMARGLFRMLPCFWLRPRGDVCGGGVDEGGAVVSRGFGGRGAACGEPRSPSFGSQSQGSSGPCCWW